ncbi:helix-turn-helix domain-containing protein [Streptomyces flavofungini]|uniref:helix-turn-helix domain-containing protein n=1 Tax=Streptomyces flavofungini TaxID=68200 RepID=UPI0025B26B08|nr:helix-turn-helix transcriptional regulator [Streptomyces flavofungini]WJV47643.1 helix-turn-helix transcriptional regulator [Streptomyces flavofungini]
MAEKQKTPLGPAGETLMHNIKRIREGQRLTFVELSERLAETRRPIPVLGLRRIERGERRVDVDDLFALAHVLGVSPVDLLIPLDLADDEPYNVTPKVSTTAGMARDWIGGMGFLSTTGAADLARALQWMPKSRADVVAARWVRRDAQERAQQEQHDQQEGEDRG